MLCTTRLIVLSSLKFKIYFTVLFLEHFIGYIQKGAAICFIRRPETWREDTKKARPFFVSFPPAFVNEIYSDYLNQCSLEPDVDPDQIGKRFENVFGNK